MKTFHGRNIIEHARGSNDGFETGMQCRLADGGEVDKTLFLLHRRQLHTFYCAVLPFF